jgi:thiopurine S-methyltransferase
MTAEDVENNDVPNPVFVIDEEINALFSADFEIDLAHVESMVGDGLALQPETPEPTEYKLYRLSARSDKNGCRAA